MKRVIIIVILSLVGINSKGQDLQVLLDSSTYYWNSEKYKEAFNLLTQAVTESKKQYEAGIANSASNYAYILNQMGVRLYMAENYETAESYYNAAIPIYKTIQGEGGADYLVCVNNLAVCYNDHGLYNESLNYYAYLLSNQVFLESQGASLYQTYNTAGICAYQTDNYELAKEFYKKGIDLLNENFEDYWVLTENLLVLENSVANYAEAYKLLAPLMVKFPEKEQEYSNTIAYYNRDMGHLEFNKGNYAGSIPYFKNTLKYLIPTDSIDQISAIYALQDLSSAYSLSRNFVEGLPYLVKNEVQVSEHYGEGHEDHMVALSNLALTYSELGDYRNAQKTYKKAFRLADKLNDPARGEQRSNLDTNYSDYLLKNGKYSEAKTHAKRAFEFYQSNGEKYFDDLIYTMNHMGILMITEGTYEKAEALLKSTLKMQMDKHGLENEMGTQIASNLTSLYIQTGRGFRASQFMDFVLANDLKLHGENSFEYSFSLQVAGVLFTSSGDHEKAINYLSKAYEIRKPMVGEENRELLRLKQSLGTAYWKAGKLDRAAEILGQVLETQKKSIGKNNFDIALTQNDLGMVFLSKNNYSNAGKLFEQSYELKKKILGAYNQFTITSIFNLACTNLLTGNKNKSLEYFNQAMKDYFHVLKEYFPHLSEKERLEYYNTIKGQLGAYFSFLQGELEEHPEYAALLYDTHIKTKALLLSESMKLKNFLRNHSDPQVKSVYNKWTTINEEVAKLEQYNNVGEKRNYLDSLKIVGEEYERTLNGLTKVSTEKKVVGWEDVASSLKDGEVAVEIVRVKDFDFSANKFDKKKISYLALIIDNKTTDFPRYIKMEEGALMDSKYFNVYKNNIKYKLEDKQSYTYFWKPIADKLVDYDKIYVSSDGAYHLLNLNTLYNPVTSKYVIEESTIEIAGNTIELINREVSQDKAEKALLFGFPNYNAVADARSLSDF